MRLFTLLVITATTLTAVRAGEAEVAEIPAVRSWGELLALAPVVDAPLDEWRQRQGLGAMAGRADAKPQQLQARIGMDSTRLRVGEAGVVYCHVTGWDGDSTGAGDPFGPLGIEILPKGVRAMRSRMAWMHARVRGEKQRGALHLRTFGFSRPGEYVVRIYDPKQNLVAQARVRCDEARANRQANWHPWGHSVPADGARATAEDRMELRVSMPTAPAAVPDLETMPVPADVADTPGTSLPRITLEAPDPRMALRRDAEGRLVLKSTVDLLAGNVRDCTLSRWWVNGEPVRFRGERALQEEARKVFQSVGVRTIIHVLDFDPGAIGAKSGDEVSVQLLYCPFGWRATDDATSLRKLCAMALSVDQPMLPRLTNTIAWRVE